MVRIGLDKNILYSYCRLELYGARDLCANFLLSRVCRLATSRSCAVETLRRSDLQLHQFVGHKITDEKYAC